ncbi:O-antigen ligase family protein [Sediminibacterium salmoneum]|uniref:O-antigen ligase family protein n=1 Tax=Sediminibacterium salmoneum TaxID=426421 RepID=UPI00047D188B|nr:O-antigen ligase family protein [Sediminibacterium salmoneum]
MEEPFQIPLGEKNNRKGFFTLLHDFFIVRKMGGIWGLFFFGAAAIFFSLVVSKLGLVPGILILLMLIGLPVVLALIFYPKFGVVTFIVAAYLIMYVGRMNITDFPLGTLMDGMELLLFLGIFVQQKTESNWALFKSPISVIILVWICYNLIQVINPTAESRLAWVYTVRSVAVIMMMFFVFLYNIRTLDFIKLILKIWIGLSVFAALYGYKQQYIGFTAFEEAYLYSDPEIAGLLFIGGQWRKFSIFTDPVAFSYNMVVSALLCIGLLTGPFSRRTKILLMISAFLCLTSMLFSGTRGAYVLPPAAMALYAILKFNKKVMVGAIIGALGFAALIFVPTTNPTIYRFQTAFKPSDDASFNVRKLNQKRIQPFIQSHPLGGGLGATGMWGKRFAPNSFLANFPPDSGYVRVAVETGWVGLLIFCTLMFIILKVGINNYYTIKDPTLKSICLAMILVIFAYHIGNYPQEAIVQFPSNTLFYLVAALIVITKRLDSQNNSMQAFNNKV